VKRDVTAFGGTSDNYDVAQIEADIGSIHDQKVAVKMSDTQMRAVFSLWIAGSTYSEIAEQLKIASVPAVRLAVEKLLADSVDMSEDRTVMRQRASLQLDRYLRSIMGRALDAQNPDQIAFLRLALQITDRKIRLHGLDAPVQVSVGLPGRDELDQWVAAVATMNGAAVPIEGDPFLELEENPETGEWS